MISREYFFFMSITSFFEWRIHEDGVHLSIVNDNMTSVEYERDSFLYHVMKKRTLSASNKINHQFFIRPQPHYTRYIHCDDHCIHVESDERSQIIIKNPFYQIHPTSNDSFFKKPIFSIRRVSSIFYYVIHIEYSYYDESDKRSYDFLLEYTQEKSDKLPDKVKWNLHSIYFLITSITLDSIGPEDMEYLQKLNDIVSHGIIPRMNQVECKDVLPDYLHPMFRMHYQMFDKTAVAVP